MASVLQSSCLVTHLLEIRGLRKTYGDKTVLDGIDLVVDRGETVVVLGGSGSGKSTLARLLVGLERADGGHIYLDGRDLTQMSERDLAEERSRFAMVFQKYALLDSLTVFDNVAFPLRERGHANEHEIREQVMGPEILVHDEPTSGLDPLTSRTVDGLIEDMRERFGVTSIVITHDMASAFAIADRVVLLHGGKIVLDGPADEILDSDDTRITSFASASGVDPERLVRRARRPSPAEIRARWSAEIAPGRLAPALQRA